MNKCIFIDRTDPSTIFYEYRCGSIVPSIGMVYNNSYVIKEILIYPNFNNLLNKDSEDVKKMFGMIEKSLMEDHCVDIYNIDIICFVNGYGENL